MLVRELRKGDRWKVVSLDGRVDRAETRAKKEFDQAVDELLARGFVESERSLSRRAFVDGTESGGRFWIIDLDGAVQRLHYGQYFSYAWHEALGMRKESTFADASKARRDYQRKIDARISGGYVEYFPRDTSYSRLAAETVSPPGKTKTARRRSAEK